uniref:Uncharacterized protein n=1 Tax=Zonotrichia albicollis TaxID=44394 RepID=A0A8D2M381_ZONAL
MKMLWKLTDNIKYEECEVSASPGPGQSPGPAAASGSLQHPSVSQFRLGKLLLRRQASLRSCSRRGAGVLPQELRANREGAPAARRTGRVVCVHVGLAGSPCLAREPVGEHF